MDTPDLRATLKVLMSFQIYFLELKLTKIFFKLKKKIKTFSHKIKLE